MRVAVLIIFISLSTSMAKAGDPTENDYHGSNRAHEIQPAGFDRALSTISPKVSIDVDIQAEMIAAHLLCRRILSGL